MTETKRIVVPAAEDILHQYYPVLDHGFVSLVDYMGSDPSVERAARVSYQAGTRKVNETRGLMRYLVRHRHTTPLEMVEVVFHVAMPIFVARQFIRHRTANVNEMSGRYSLLPMLFYTPKEEQFTSQSKSNNQGRSSELNANYHVAVGSWNLGRAHNVEIYTDLAEADVARELARIDLPLSTYTQWYWKCDLHNALHFLKLRCDGHAQWEIREFANVMAAMIQMVAPLSFEAWIDYQFCAVVFSRLDRLALDRHIATITSGGITNDEMKELGMNQREIDEFWTKLRNVPDYPAFPLSDDLFMDAEVVEAKMAAATPKIDQKEV